MDSYEKWIDRLFPLARLLILLLQWTLLDMSNKCFHLKWIRCRFGMVCNQLPEQVLLPIRMHSYYLEKASTSSSCNDLTSFKLQIEETCRVFNDVKGKNLLIKGWDSYIVLSTFLARVLSFEHVGSSNFQEKLLS